MIKAILTVFALFSAPKLVKTDDVGMIAYFASDCPDGWEYYSSLSERVPVGQGGSYTLLATGGAKTHTLTVAQMPSHRHRLPQDQGSIYNMQSLTHTSTSDEGFNNIYSEAVGGNQPHNNMQPYLVLRPCIKVVADNYAVQSDFLSLQGKVDLINSTQKSDITALKQIVNGINDTSKTNFIYLQESLASLNNTYIQAILLLSTSSENADEQHQSHLDLLDNRTEQIVTTQLEQSAALQQQIDKVNVTSHLDILNLRQSLIDVNSTLQIDIEVLESGFVYLENTLQDINSTYATEIASLKQASDVIDEQQNSYLFLLNNRTTQIIATQAKEVTALTQSISEVNTTCQLYLSHVVSSLVDLNNTFQADTIKVWQQMYILNHTYIYTLESQVGSLQQQIIILKQRLNATESPTPAPTNRVPVVNEQIPTKYATVGKLFEYIVPENTFSDSDEDRLSLSSALVDDSALPNWLNFNPDSRKFFGRPSTEDKGDLFVKLTATDLAAAQVSEVFPLIVQDTTPSPTFDPLSITDDNVEINYNAPASSSNPLGAVAIVLSSVNMAFFTAFIVYYYCKETRDDKSRERLNSSHSIKNIYKIDGSSFHNKTKSNKAEEYANKDNTVPSTKEMSELIKMEGNDEYEE